jgi:hypothetical protein
MQDFLVAVFTLPAQSNKSGIAGSNLQIQQPALDNIKYRMFFRQIRNESESQLGIINKRYCSTQ